MRVQGDCRKRAGGGGYFCGVGPKGEGVRDEDGADLNFDARPA